MWGFIWVALVLHLLVHSIMCKNTQINLSNGRLDPALEDTLYGWLNVALEGAL